jgi:hypothetical protein
MMRALSVIVLVAACSKQAEKQPAEQKPAAVQPAAAPGSAAAIDPQLIQFCAQSYFKMMDCFKDEEFWEVFATMYFANTSLAADDVERKHWVGMIKEDLLKLYREHGFEDNCKAALEHNKAPSPRSMKLVNEARAQSCAAFGNAFGYMVFHEGALHLPK